MRVELGWVHVVSVAWIFLPYVYGSKNASRSTAGIAMHSRRDFSRINDPSRDT